MMKYIEKHKYLCSGTRLRKQFFCNSTSHSTPQGRTGRPLLLQSSRELIHRFVGRSKHFCLVFLSDFFAIFGHRTVLVMASPSIHNNVVPSEVGWQFVPQYYTYVNKQPQRLHCFYTKSSTFIHGTEGEDGKPAFGQQVGTHTRSSTRHTRSGI